MVNNSQKRKITKFLNHKPTHLGRFFYYKVYLLFNMENISGIIVAFISGVIGPIGVMYIKHTLEKKKPKPDMVTEALRVGELVTAKIEHIKEEFNADRVWITQFHNGGNFYPTGKSIAKFSIIYETVNANVTSIQTNLKNIPVNLFSKSINELLNNDVIEISDFKDESIATYGLKYFAEDTGTKSTYQFAIKTIEDRFIGTVGLDYTKRKTRLDMESINHLQVHASSLGGVLMSHLQK
jgi:hypothetical protein